MKQISKNIFFLLLCLYFISLTFISCSIFLEDLREGAACPSFTCEKKTSDDNVCFSTTGNEEEGTRKIVINTCPAFSFCLVTNFFRKDNVSCKKPFGEKNSWNLPGESCTHNLFSTCKKVKLTKSGTNEIYETNECRNLKCVGNKLNEKCVEMDSCEVGSYCDGYDLDKKILGTCKSYKKDGDACKSTYECGFKSFCYGGVSGTDEKCFKKFSLKLGSEVYFPTVSAACESVTVGKDTDGKYKCAVIVYDTDRELVKNEFLECQYGSFCNYKYRFSDSTDKDVKDEELKQKCGCSFDGKGYCPIANGVMKNRFNAIKKAKSYVEASEYIHHTNNRNSEYVNSPKDLQYGEICRKFYSSTLSFNSGTCPSITDDFSGCTYFPPKPEPEPEPVINSSFIKSSWLILFIIAYIFN